MLETCGISGLAHYGGSGDGYGSLPTDFRVVVGKTYLENTTSRSSPLKYVRVTSTKHTSMASPEDTIHLAKILGISNEEAGLKVDISKKDSKGTSGVSLLDSRCQLSLRHVSPSLIPVTGMEELLLLWRRMLVDIIETLIGLKTSKNQTHSMVEDLWPTMGACNSYCESLEPMAMPAGYAGIDHALFVSMD
nr:exosome complex exonuclease RRP44 homolog A [Tanacetum cinerariifolium]